MVIFKITENTAKPAQLAAGSTLSARARKQEVFLFLLDGLLPILFTEFLHFAWVWRLGGPQRTLQYLPPEVVVRRFRFANLL